MRVIVTEHARQRLKEGRQIGILIQDVVNAAQSIPGKIAGATRFRGFVSSDGCVFDIVAKDLDNGRLVITVIGK
jgi:hypothetical protein